MSDRNVTVRYTCCKTAASIAAVLLLCGWTATAGVQAAPFEADAGLPSVLATPAADVPFGSGHAASETIGSWRPADDVTATDEGSRPGPVQVSEDSGLYQYATASDDACPTGSMCHVHGACEPAGILEHLHAWHQQGCWIGRADGLLLWRDAPPERPIVESGVIPVEPILDANQLNSTATGGVKGSILRIDRCTGHGWEGGYLYAGTFTARRNLPVEPAFPYALAPPGIYGNNDSQPFDSGTVTLLARLQGAEINRLIAGGPNLRWLAGFRWVQWHERFTLQDTLDDGFNPPINDLYQTTCDNNLYGGQIGVDARLLSLGLFRVDSGVKAGAYYNTAVQTSSYTTDDPAFPGTASVSVGQSPAACSFVGEVGLTGVLPISSNLDFRFGYVGLWLTGLAQPTQQLSGQQLTPGIASIGSITTNGGVLLQGVTLGLEGRW